MALQTSAFPNGFVAGIHAVGWAFIVPCFWFLDRLIAVCKSTTLEQSQRLEQECYLRPLEVLFGSITFFILFLATAPLAFLGFLLWAPLQACRRPFSYHREMPFLPEKATNKGFELTGKASFVFASANLCLLPDSLARFNNLANTQSRATAIGQCIVQGISRPNIRILVDSPSSCGTLSPSTSILPTVNSPTYGATVSQHRDPAEMHDLNLNSNIDCVPSDDTEEPLNESTSPLLNSNRNSNQQDQSSQQNPQALSSQGLRQQNDVPLEISLLFPANVDILCLEEVFDKRAAQKLTNILKLEFGHILYDIGVYACQPPCRCSSFKFFNSGLFLASRFPVLEAQYHCFPNSRGEDALAAKGLLSVKVHCLTSPSLICFFFFFKPSDLLVLDACTTSYRDKLCSTLHFRSMLSYLCTESGNFIRA